MSNKIKNYNNFIPKHPYRRVIYNKLLELLKKQEEFNIKNLNLQKVALNIERGIFNYSLNYSKETEWNEFFKYHYHNRLVTIYTNLNSYSYLKNENLIKRLFNQEFNEFELTFFTGKELYRLGGVDYLFYTMRILVEDLMYSQSNSKHLSQYYIDLRELEFCWNNISDKFQA